MTQISAEIFEKIIKFAQSWLASSLIRKTISAAGLLLAIRQHSKCLIVSISVKHSGYKETLKMIHATDEEMVE